MVLNENIGQTKLVIITMIMITIEVYSDCKRIDDTCARWRDESYFRRVLSVACLNPR